MVMWEFSKATVEEVEKLFNVPVSVVLDALANASDKTTRAFRTLIEKRRALENCNITPEIQSDYRKAHYRVIRLLRAEIKKRRALDDGNAENASADRLT